MKKQTILQKIQQKQKIQSKNLKEEKKQKCKREEICVPFNLRKTTKTKQKLLLSLSILVVF